MPQAGSSSSVVTRSQSAIIDLTLHLTQRKPLLNRFIAGSITCADLLSCASVVLPEGSLRGDNRGVSLRFSRMCQAICSDMGLDFKTIPIAKCQPILSNMFPEFPLSEHDLMTVWDQLASHQPPQKKQKRKATRDQGSTQVVSYSSMSHQQLVEAAARRDNDLVVLRNRNKSNLDHLRKARTSCANLRSQLVVVTRERDEALAELTFKGDHKKKCQLLAVTTWH